MTTPAPTSEAGASGLDTEFTRGLGLFDSTMVVVGSMIGSGIFIVSPTSHAWSAARAGCSWRGSSPVR
jgi:hypothetical protein